MHIKMFADQPRASRARRLLAVTSCTTALVAVPLCSPAATASAQDGIEDLSAQEIIDKALDAFTSAQSLRVTGTDKSADLGPDDPSSLDLFLDRDGDCNASVQFKDGSTAMLVKRGDEIWLKGDDAYWKTEFPGDQGERAAELFKNRYAHGSASDAELKDLAGVCDLETIQKQAAEEARESTNLRKGDPTTVDGTPTIPVLSTEDGLTHTVYVATEGKPYPLKKTKKGNGTDVTGTFKDYNKPVPSETPSADESVDISKLFEETPSP
ncbi:hypothetical protein ABT009_14315 [Streptomyces sp. NPDC002896]|uniref:hypothetical protein n=1 Tax=Streptomyces sp. NPDC002896 TaxID=3154438 RepID=UPI003331693F